MATTMLTFYCVEQCCVCVFVCLCMCACVTVCECLCVSVCVSVMPVFVRGHPLSVWFIMCVCGAVFKNILTSGQAAPALFYL